MGTVEDTRKIAEQETNLVFATFDEAAAYDIGSAIRSRALAEKLNIVVDIRMWDRSLFYCALPGSTPVNGEWTRRKINTVRQFHKSSYRMALQKGREDRTFAAGEALSPADYVLAGGGFPITVKGVGVVGAIAVSGLPERQDHEVVVAALCAYLGLDLETFALGPIES